MIDIEALKKNHKTQYLAEQYEGLLRQEQETNELIQSDPSMAEMAQEELSAIAIQKTALEEQFASIEASEKEEEGAGTRRRCSRSSWWRCTAVMPRARAGSGR